MGVHVLTPTIRGHRVRECGQVSAPAESVTGQKNSYRFRREGLEISK